MPLPGLLFFPRTRSESDSYAARIPLPEYLILNHCPVRIAVLRYRAMVCVRAGPFRTFPILTGTPRMPLTFVQQDNGLAGKAKQLHVPSFRPFSEVSMRS
jgi:hypothetical protein